jgi:hypothetical protein
MERPCESWKNKATRYPCMLQEQSELTSMHPRVPVDTYPVDVYGFQEVRISRGNSLWCPGKFVIAQLQVSHPSTSVQP